MTDSEALEVCDLKRALDKKRHEAMKAFLAWWDMLPENKALKDAMKQKCVEYGHEFKQIDKPNPFGYTWKSCVYCHERIDIEGPFSEEMLEAVKPVGVYPVRVPNIPTSDHRRKSKPCPKCYMPLAPSGLRALGMAEYSCQSCGVVRYFDRSGTWTINGVEFEPVSTGTVDECTPKNILESQ